MPVCKVIHEDGRAEEFKVPHDWYINALVQGHTKEGLAELIASCVDDISKLRDQVDALKVQLEGSKVVSNYYHAEADLYSREYLLWEVRRLQKELKEARERAWPWVA